MKTLMPSKPTLKAAGLEWRGSGGKWRAYWRAPKRAQERGFQPCLVPVHSASVFLDDGARVAILAHCRRLQAEALAFLDREGKPLERRHDGTLGSLIEAYRTVPHSPYHRVKWNTRRSYDLDLARLKAGAGDRMLAKVGYPDIHRWYLAAKRPRPGQTEERIRSARGLMVMLKLVIGFGVLQETPHCKRISDVLSEARWEAPKPRRARVTFDDAVRIVTAAHEAGAFSIALGQALQFEGMFRQEDVTGQWQPLEPWEDADGPLCWTPRRERWANGLQWPHLDARGVISFRTGKTGRAVVVDVNRYPLLKAEIDRVPISKRTGPMIVDERSGLPYRPKEYGKRWRKLANQADLPKNIWNRDSRAGGISEGRDAGAQFDDLAKQAGHANPSTTAKVYDRSEEGPAQRVADRRTAYRKVG